MQNSHNKMKTEMRKESVRPHLHFDSVQFPLSLLRIYPALSLPHLSMLLSRGLLFRARLSPPAKGQCGSFCDSSRAHSVFCLVQGPLFFPPHYVISISLCENKLPVSCGEQLSSFLENINYPEPLLFAKPVMFLSFSQPIIGIKDL